jgi:hypothetical protein
MGLAVVLVSELHKRWRPADGATSRPRAVSAGVPGAVR